MGLYKKNILEWDPEERRIVKLDYPCYYGIWSGGDSIFPRGDTHFGYVFSGKSLLRYGGREFLLELGMYFSVPGEFTISGGSGIVISRVDHRAFFTIGGPAEDRGRLRYINGCTDSLLIGPVKLGDPCLNLLHFPADIDQTSHYHPSVRIGIIMSGGGEGLIFDREYQQSIPLHKGDVFMIDPGTIHKFRTADQEMRILSFHPESDFGPEDHFHPMINRTILGKPD